MDECQIGLSGLLIDTEGEIRICRNMEAIGNIKTDLPEEAWNSKKAKEIREKIKKCEKSCKILTCHNLDQGEF